MDNLKNMLTSEDESERLYAVQDMAESGKREYCPLLLGRLRIDESQLVKDAIVSGLKRLDCSEMFDPLFELFVSDDAYLRNQSVGILASQKDDAIGYLATKFDHADRDVRKLILDVLFEIGSPDAVLAIRAYVNDASPNVKIAAVEYLGRLGDKQSVDDLLSLIEHETEPMLRSSVLDTLGLIGERPDIRRVLKAISPNGRIDQVDALYLPQLIRLIARTGDRESLVRVLASIQDVLLYAEDFLSAVNQANRRFPDLTGEETICSRLVSVIRAREVRTGVRLSAAEMLASQAARGGALPGILFKLGLDLMNEPEMSIAAVRLLAASGNPDAHGLIRDFISGIRDDGMRMLCADSASSG